MKTILVCSNNLYFKHKIKKKNYIFVSDKNKLNFDYVKKINPDIIFFPHWNFLVNKKITNNFVCIGFHATPLPYGRGGSPIQNMIIKGHKSTKLCSFKLTNKIDDGEIYLKKFLSLKGSGEEIFKRLYSSILIMMSKIEKKIPKSKKQIGKAVYFKRRISSQGNLLNTKSLKEAFNLIRMLDINFLDYPKAFIESKKIIIKFKNAKLKKNKIEAFVEILRK